MGNEKTFDEERAAAVDAVGVALGKLLVLEVEHLGVADKVGTALLNDARVHFDIDLPNLRILCEMRRGAAGNVPLFQVEATNRNFVLATAGQELLD